CPWGRISNGKGMLQRCISEAEATKVLSDTKKPAVPAAGAVVATPSTHATAAPAAPASTPVDAPVAEPTKPSGPVSVKLSPIVAEQGEVGLGKLAKPLDKYAACIEENGGLTAAKGSVTIQFLVRAELARAEGVEVKKVSGVSAKAARCLADVVDRRQVGAPTVPMTGATLTFEISPSK
ncbi:MAG TPA: hypothetical protein VLC09_04820, partial [Polyangiaceae bacterium]|nr:hypothetical protein [Polyangiaceae bacterium]